LQVSKRLGGNMEMGICVLITLGSFNSLHSWIVFQAASFISLLNPLLSLPAANAWYSRKGERAPKGISSPDFVSTLRVICQTTS